MSTSGEKPHEDDDAAKQDPSSNVSEELKSLKTGEPSSSGGSPSHIKRVKASQQVIKTMLEVDACKNAVAEICEGNMLTKDTPSQKTSGYAKLSQSAKPPVSGENFKDEQAAPKSVSKITITRVKGSAEITKTVLEVDAVESGLFEDGTALNEIRPSIIPSADTTTAMVAPVATVATPPVSPAQKEPPAPDYKNLDDAEATEAFLNRVNKVSQLKRVKGNTAIAKTKLDLDACRDVAFNTVEQQVEKFKEIIETQSAVPVKDFKPIDKYRNASPCSSSWEKMTGATGCMKFCEQCQSIVYDFSKVELEQAEQIIFQREDRESNIFLYRRKDGKFLANDCPVGAARKQFKLVALAVSLLLVTGGAIYLICQPPPKKVAAVKVVQPPGQPILPNPNLVAAIEQPAEPEEPRVATSLPKTKFSFDKASYVKRIKFLKDKGTDTTKYEKALHKIEQDIDAGKHRYYIEPQLQELGLSIGLIKREVVVAQQENGIITDIRRPNYGASSKTGFAVGFRKQLPKAAAEVEAYNATRISDDIPLHITDLIAGSAAGKAGLRVGYRILEINGTSVEGLTIPEVQSMLKEAGNNVAVGVQLGPTKMKTVMLGRPTDPLPR